MTFDEYWLAQVERGLPATEVNRAICKDTWDAAICAVQTSITEKGRFIVPAETVAKISNLHTW